MHVALTLPFRDTHGVDAHKDGSLFQRNEVPGKSVNEWTSYSSGNWYVFSVVLRVFGLLSFSLQVLLISSLCFFEQKLYDLPLSCLCTCFRNKVDYCLGLVNSLPPWGNK